MIALLLFCRESETEGRREMKQRLRPYCTTLLPNPEYNGVWYVRFHPHNPLANAISCFYGRGFFEPCVLFRGLRTGSNLLNFLLSLRIFLDLTESLEGAPGLGRNSPVVSYNPSDTLVCGLSIIEMIPCILFAREIRLIRSTNFRIKRGWR